MAEYLERKGRQQRGAAEQAVYELTRRQTEATERSADEARKTRRLAWLALWVSLGALVVSAWPYLKDLTGV